MIKHIMATIILWLAVVAAFPLYAQQRNEYTLGRLWSKVDENYPGVGAKTSAIDAVTFNQRAVKGNMLPQVNAQAQNTYGTYKGSAGTFFAQAGFFNVSSSVVPLDGSSTATNTGNGIDRNTTANQRTNGEKPLVLKAQQTPDLKFKDENGKTISLRSLKGKVVFINLWATWCLPCIHEMPSINELRKTFKGKDDIVFLMVNVDGNIKKAKKWMKNKKFDLPVHVPDSEIPRELFAGSIPTTIIIDKQNNIIGRQVGAADYMSQEVVDLMKKLLNEK